jgi:PAS domain S-box-containing protein
VERSLALEQPLKHTATQIFRIGQWAQEYIGTHEYQQRIPRLRLLLEQYARHDYFDLERLEPPFNRRNTGNLFGLGVLDNRDRSLNRELDMALDLFRVQSLSLEMTASVSRSYYLSARNFISVFPWMPTEELLKAANAEGRLFFENMYLTDVWCSALPGGNAGREATWTGPHKDIVGGSLVTTYSVPIYDNGHFLGIVGGELEPAFINNVVQSLDVGDGQLVLATGNGEVVASTLVETQTPVNRRTIAEVLPKHVAALIPSLTGPLNESALREKGIFVRKLDSAPWFLIYVLPETEIARQVLPVFSIILLIILGLVAFLVITQVAIRKHFVRPAIAMAEFIEAETIEGSAQVPEVPSQWEPWFRRIAATLRLKEVERHLRSFMESATGFVVYQLGVDALNPNTSRVLFVSPSMQDIMGVADPYKFEHWFENVHPTDKDRVLQSAKDSFAHGTPFDETMRTFHPGRGEWVWIHAAATPLRDSKGQLAYFNGLIIDITERKKVEKDLERELIKFRVLYEVATAMTSERSLEENLDLVINKVRLLMGTDSSYIALMSEQEGFVEMHACSGINTDAFKQMRIPLGSGLGGRVAQQRRGIIVRDYFKETDPRLHDVVRAEGLISGMAVPIQVGPETLGVLYAFNRTPTIFTANDLETLSLIGNLAALEISRRNFEKQVQAARDQLELRVQQRTAELLDTNTRLSREIAVRMATEEALQQSENMLRTIFNVSRDPIMIHTVDGRLVDVNDRMLEEYEVTRDQALTMSLQDDYSSEDNPIALLPALWAQTVQGKDQFFEWKARRPNDESVFPVEVFLTKLPTRSGDLILANVHNLSERKQREEELQFQKAYADMLFDYSPDAIAIMNTEDRVEKINKAFSHLFGYSEAEAVGRPINVLVAPPDLVHEAQEFSSAVIRGERVDADVVRKRKDGSLIDLSLVGASVMLGDERKNLFAIYRDNTERKKTLMALKEREELYRSLVEAIPYGIIEADTKGSITFTNRALTEILGYSQEELSHMSVLDILASDEDRKEFILFGQMLFKEQPPPGTWHGQGITKEGSIIDAQVDWNYRRGGDGEIAGFITIVTDVTVRKRAEQALRESEEKYRLVVENAAEGIAVIQHGYLRLVNPRLQDMAGYTLAELLEKPVEEFIHPEDREAAERFQKSLLGDQAGLEAIVCRLLAKDGAIRWIQVKGVGVEWEGKPAGLNFITDITDAKKMEEDLIKVEKLESIGVLAGGIAHDFNNVLTAILGNISMARLSVERDGVSSKRLQEAEKACYRARDLTQQLLAFAKGGAPVKETLDISTLIREACQLSLRGTSCLLDLDFPQDVWAVQGDRGQLIQVITNLCINAVQAMPRGGSLDISARNIEVKGGDILLLEKGRYVEVVFRDQGHGIEPQYLSKIFDPYFTTKPTGSGLGLATAYAVMRNHGGLITVDSEEGKGAVFQLYLPASPDKPSVEQQEPAMVQSGKVRVLIMDDEEAIRSMVSDLLMMLGYEASASRDGLECLEAYTEAMQEGRPFDLVILDLTVPGAMGGAEAIKGLLEIDPDVKAIVSSGYADSPIMSKFKEHGFADVIKKPYDVNQLCMVIDRVLNKTPDMSTQ